MTGARPGQPGHLSVAIDQRLDTGFHIALNLSIPLMGITAVFGPSGSGKTTLLDTIAGLRPDLRQASVNLGNTSWQGPEGFLPPWQRRLAYVFQDARLFPDRSVDANLTYAQARAPQGGYPREDVVSWLGLQELRERNPATLSAGEQQRVAIARALLRNPSLLLLDEPLSNLDARSAGECLTALRRVQRETGLPMVYVSHDLEEIHRIADQVLVLRKGRLVAEGPLLELASRLDARLAEGEDAAAILEVETAEEPPADGLRAVRADGQTLWVGSAAPGSRRLRIPARDVSVCRQRPRQTSILNILECELESLRDAGEAHCLLRLRLDHQYLLARITQRSRRELNLNVGDKLFAQVKSTALLGDGRSS